MPTAILYPTDERHWLTLETVLFRLSNQFEHVDTDPDDGRAQVEELICRVMKYDPPTSIIARLREQLAHAVVITAWNEVCSPENGVQFLWMKEDIIKFQYHPKARRYVTKLKRALGYELEIE